jgi:hypothetical protein
VSGTWPRVLLFVFTTHLPFFAWRWHVTGERRYAATTLTFALLVVTYGLAVFAPELRVGETRLFEIVRVVAWASAAVSIALLVRHHAARIRGKHA